MIQERKQPMIEFLYREKFWKYANQQPKTRVLTESLKMQTSPHIHWRQLRYYFSMNLCMFLRLEFIENLIVLMKLHNFIFSFIFTAGLIMRAIFFFFVCLNYLSSSWVKVPSIQAKYIVPRSWAQGRIYCMCSWQWSQCTVDYEALSASLAVQTLNLVKRGS